MAYYDTFDRLVKGKKLILFGAGALGVRTVLTHLENYEVSYFCDNDSKKWGTEILGIPICSPEKLQYEDIKNTIVLITTLARETVEVLVTEWMGIPTMSLDIFNSPCEMMKHLRERLILKHCVLSSQKDELNKVYELLADERSRMIFNQLLRKYREGNIYFGDVCEDDMYFNDIFEDCMDSNEVYVDGGVFDGATILQFIKYAKGRYEEIHGFEPNRQSFNETFVNLQSQRDEDMDKIKLYDYALSDFNGTGNFEISNHPGASNLNKNGDCFVKIKKLDDVINGKVTFIKLDIEGTEYEALVGAKRIIQTDKPKLAISAYHKPDDLVRLPLLLHKMVPEYKLYLRHHTLGLSETVLYARV